MTHVDLIEKLLKWESPLQIDVRLRGYFQIQPCGERQVEGHYMKQGTMSACLTTTVVLEN